MNRRNALIMYFQKYKKTYIVITILFLIGVSIGVIYINSLNEEKMNNIEAYANNLLKNIENLENQRSSSNLINSILQNSKIILIIWFLGCTIIGSYIVYLVIVYKGFKIGYIVSTFIYTLGSRNGILLSISLLALQNIIYIPTIFLISESSIKMCREIYKSRSNIKREILRHTAILLLCIILGIIASFIEVYISTFFLKFFKEIL